MSMRQTFAATALAAALLSGTCAAASTASAAPVAPAGPSAAAGVGYCGWYDGNALTVQGHTGNRVREVQCLLDAWGFDVGPAGIDGRFGPDTTEAVRAFQAWFGGLTIDGKVGANTWAALRS